MTKRVWKSGPPPHVGWWNASCNRMNDAWRWWDGSNWSTSALPNNSAEFAGMCADIKPFKKNIGVEWTTYYPKNARVPRVNPNK